MSHDEREVKLRVRSAAEALDRLLEAGAREVTPRRAERNTVHDDEAATLASSDRVLRVRSHGGERAAGLLTYKGPGRIESGMKVREEVETAVDDAEALRAVLERVGLPARFRYDKRRTTLAWGEALLCLDETPLGDFVEVEGSPDDVVRVREALGVGADAEETRSYPALWREARAGADGTLPDMVFAETPTGSDPGGRG